MYINARICTKKYFITLLEKEKNMKKLFAFSIALLLSACAEGSIYKQYDQDCNDHFYSSKACPAKKEIVQKSEPVASTRTYQRKPSKIRLVAQNENLPAATSQASRHVYMEERRIPVETVKIEAPAPVLVAEPTHVVVADAAPVVVADSGCNGCAPIVRQTREPVEIVYKKTTYTTVFEPKTTSTVTYEKEPVINQKVVTGVQVVQPTKVKVVPTEVKVVPAQKKRVRTVVTKTQPVVNTVSYTIENTHTTAPSELLIEEIK